MTTISQPPQPTHAQANVSQSVLAKSPSPSNSGTISPHAAVPAPAARSYANASRKTFSPPPAPAKVGTTGVTEPQAQQSIRSDVNAPAVPSLGAPTIVNGNTGVNSNSALGDHSRKSSVTLNALGNTSYLPNGGSVAKPGANGIQFGQIGMTSASASASPIPSHSTPHVNQSGSSLSVSSSMNPRVTSPAHSPSPIPQPLQASGGKPPASLHGQANSLSFGNFGGEETNSTRPGNMSQGGLTPNMTPAHMRRESSQSSHGDMTNSGMGPGQPRFPNHAGRSRGYPLQYPQQASYSPGQSSRGPIPSQPRGGPNMAPQYQNQGRPMSQPFPNSPHLAARSPAPAHSMPMHPQAGQMPMQSPQMQYQPHHYGAYGQPVGMPQNFAFPPGYDHYSPYAYPMNSQLPPYIPPQSPRPPFHNPQTQPQYQQPMAPYPPQQAAPPMSRSSSNISELPNSVAGPPPSMTPSQSNQSVASTRTASISTPKTEQFKIPSRISHKIQIVDPNSKAAIKFDKQPASPAPTSTQSPANVSTPTPPPSTPIHSEHHRTDSKSIKTDAEKKNEMRDLVAKRLEDARLEEQRKKDEEAAKLAREKEAAEAKVRQEREEAERKAEAAAKEKREAEEAATKAKAEEEAAQALAKEAADKAEQERKQKEEDEEFARMEEEMERKEREAEERYLKKKAAEKEEKARKEAEEAAHAEENMRKAEREAEAAEEARLQKMEAGEGEGEESRKERINLFAALKKTDGPSPLAESPAAATPAAESGAATPVSDSSSMAPPPRTIGNKQKPLPLTLKTTKEVEAAQPSAALQSLRSARFLQDVKDSSLYPSGIMSPNPALNSAAPMGKFKYDKAFLLQFQKVFVEKPSETWVDRVKETVGDTSETPTRAGPSRTQASIGSRQPSQRPNLPPSFGPMGSFGGPAGRGMPNQIPGQGFQRPMPGPVRNMTQPNLGMGFPMGAGQQMGSRNPSSTGMSHPHSPRGAPSSRGGAGGSRKGNQQARRDTEKEAKSMPLTVGMDLKPIEVSASGWKARSIGASAKMSGPPPGGDGYLAPDIVQRKVKAALNKMTPNNFDKISVQILEIVEQSKKETDGRTLRQVIQLTFEKATDEAHWAGMYANFCQRMLEYMTPEIRDETLPLDKNGNVNAGVGLFRKYLLNRCQAEFEQGWETKLPDKPEGEPDQTTMLSDEYYVAAAAKRRGLGLVRFIGELYKLSMLTSRIMHMCVKKLLDFEGLPGEAEVESLTNLLKTVGVNLDSEDKMRPTMDAYFDRMNRIVNQEGLPSRLRFMLMDIIDLRSKQWRVKGGEAAKGPQTIEQIREQAAAAEREKEQQRIADSSRNRGGGGGPRMPMGRGDARNFSGGGNQYGMPPPDYSRNTLAASDLQRLKAGNRQSSSQGATSFGPSSMFSANRGSNTRRTLAPNFGRGGEDSGASSRTGTPPQKKEEKEATSNNAFSALASLGNAESNDATSPPQTSAVPASAAKAEGGAQGKSDGGDAPSS